MSGWLRRLSATYRTAVSAEAAGEYIEAAKAYALCDERHKVAEMHILEAGRRAVPGSAVGELLVAVNLLSDDREAPALLLKRLGEALLHIFDTARPSQESPTTQQLWLLLGVHSLLHLRTAISEGLPPVQPSQSDEPLSDSLALYAMVCRHWPWLATPPDVQTDQQIFRYQAACAELGGRERQQLLHTRCLQALSR